MTRYFMQFTLIVCVLCVVSTAAALAAGARFHTRLIVATSSVDGDSQMVLIDETRGLDPLLPLSDGVARAVWSPDGSQLLVVSGRHDLNLIDFAGDAIYGFRNEGCVAGGATPAWSPDGLQLAYRSECREGFLVPAGEMMIMNVNCLYQRDDCADHAQQLSPAQAPNGAAVWSPDGRTIAFVAYRNNTSEIYLKATDAESAVRLTNNDTFDDGPAWSPNGRLLAFTSYRYRTQHISVMDIESSSVQSLAVGPIAGSPAWSPDGRWIAFVSTELGNPNVYMIDAECLRLLETCGDKLRLLTSHGAADVGPAWSPDGTEIAFSSNRDGNYEIYLMQVADAPEREDCAADPELCIPVPRRLTFTSDYDETNPMWRP